MVHNPGGDEPASWEGGQPKIHPTKFNSSKELDLKNWKLIGERHYLWRGAMYGGVFVEGP